MNNITDKQIVEFLDRLGFKHSLNGFSYAVSIIKACIEDPAKKKSIVKTYAEVAEQVGTTAQRFERSFRHSICRSDITGMTCKEFLSAAIDSLTFGTKMPGEHDG